MPAGADGQTKIGTSCNINHLGVGRSFVGIQKDVWERVKMTHKLVPNPTDLNESCNINTLRAILKGSLYQNPPYNVFATLSESPKNNCRKLLDDWMDYHFLGICSV
jgi:hypothetical protein